MKRQSYLPDNDADILALLVHLDTTLPGDLATKYQVSADDLLTLRHGRYSFGWFLAAGAAARKWSESVTDARESMFAGTFAGLEPLPDPPILPPVPTFGTPPVPAQYAPGFVDFLNRLVQDIKNSKVYDEADGILLKIVGPEIPPPDPQTVPVIEWELGTGGQPVIIVPKGPFQGYTVLGAVSTPPLAPVGFSTTRKFAVPLPMPAPGQAAVWRVQVQYRYKNAPFGQLSQIVEIPVRG